MGLDPEAAVPKPLDERSETVALAGGAGLNVIGSVIDQLSRLVTTILLGQLLGPSGVGIYYQAFALHELADLSIVGGLRNALTRFVAVHRVEGDEARLRGVVRLGLGGSIALAVSAGAMLFMSAGWISTQILDDPRLGTPLRLIAVALPATVFTHAALAVTRGFRTMKPYAMIGLLFQSGFRFVLTVILLARGGGVEEAVAALLVANYCAAILSARAVWKLLPRTDVVPRYAIREVLSFSAITWGSTVAMLGLTWADTLLLGALSSSRDVGIYQVSTRIVLLSAVFVVPLGMALAPRVADLAQRKRWDLLDRVYKATTGWLIRLSVPFAIILILYPERLLSVFGEGFTAGATVTRILAFAAIVHALTGPADQILVMIGKPARVLTTNASVVTANIALNVALIPAYGIEGAAVAWLLSIVVMNALLGYQVFVSLRALPMDRQILKTAAAAGAALAVGLIARALLEGPAELVGGGVALGAAFAAVLLVLGLNPEDRMVIEAVRRRHAPKGG